MRVKFFVLIAIFSMFFAACDKKMKWENENDPNSDIYGKCEEGQHKCYGSYISLVCRDGKWESFSDCSAKRPCVVETGECLAPESDDVYYGDEDGSYVENNRVVVQLAWKQGFKSQLDSQQEEGVAVDLDLHLVKRNSLEAEQYGFERTDGLLGTSMKNKGLNCDVEDPACEKYWRHDDCSAFDNGKLTPDIEATIAWGASFGIDNMWGGGNYEHPETVTMGSTKDAVIDASEPVIPDDQYLVVVSYGNCNSNYRYGEDRCKEGYQGDGAAYEVDARVTILVDGEEVPRAAADDRPADHYYETTKDFKIKLHEWKVVAVINWDNSLKGPESNPQYSGNAVVSDTPMPDQGIEIDPVRYPVCVFDTSDAVLVPVWNAEDYQDYIQTPRSYNDDEEYWIMGECHQPDEPSLSPGDKRNAHCTGLLSGAEWNTVSGITQEWDGASWQPSAKGTYNEEASTTECRFKCKENYTWNGSKCVADTRTVTCENLPENAEWNTVSEITQTWTGSDWSPSSTGVYNEAPSTEYCYFKCREHYDWDMYYSCRPGTQTVACTGKPANATWNVSIIYQTWDENAGEYLPSSESSYYDGDNVPSNTCTFRCDEYHDWIDSNCLKNPCLPDNPCFGLENSNGNCSPENNYTEYSCGCENETVWDGTCCVPMVNTFPECSPSSTFPCFDSSSGLIWSYREHDNVTWDYAGVVCGSMNNDGYGSGWRLPTISELRTLIKECNGTKMPDGTCGVRDDDVVCLSEDCQDESCYSCNDESEHSKFGETGWFWSSSLVTGKEDNAWGVGFQGADVYSNPRTGIWNVRCVKPMCASGYVWNAETKQCYVPIECNPNTCFKTHTCSGTGVLGIEMTGTAEGHGTCNNTNGICECEQGWLTGTSSFGTGTTMQCEAMGSIFETLNNVECTVCDKNNPPSEYAASGCPQEKTGDTSLCSDLSSAFCGPNGSCYYEPDGGHQLYCVCGDGYHLDNGDKYTGFCESDGDI